MTYQEHHPSDMNGANEFPKDSDERKKCVDFLRDFKTSFNDSRKYIDQLSEISNRQRKVLEISLDDVYAFANDEEFVDNIKNNTQRYLRYFEAGADELIPAASYQTGEKDVFDILQVNIRQNTSLRTIWPFFCSGEKLISSFTLPYFIRKTVYLNRTKMKKTDGAIICIRKCLL